MLSWWGSRCWIRINAMPVRAGRASINLVQASSPPADAPMATMVRPAIGGPRGAVTGFGRLSGMLPCPSNIGSRRTITRQCHACSKRRCADVQTRGALAGQVNRGGKTQENCIWIVTAEILAMKGRISLYAQLPKNPDPSRQTPSRGRLAINIAVRYPFHRQNSRYVPSGYWGSQNKSNTPQRGLK